MANEDVRELLKDEGLQHWKMAKRLNMSESTFCRKLRTELSTEEQERIKKEIENYRKERFDEQIKFFNERNIYN